MFSRAIVCSLIYLHLTWKRCVWRTYHLVYVLSSRMARSSTPPDTHPGVRQNITATTPMWLQTPHERAAKSQSEKWLPTAYLSMRLDTGLTRWSSSQVPKRIAKMRWRFVMNYNRICEREACMSARKNMRWWCDVQGFLVCEDIFAQPYGITPYCCWICAWECADIVLLCRLFRDRKQEELNLS